MLWRHPSAATQGLGRGSSSTKRPCLTRMPARAFMTLLVIDHPASGVSGPMPVAYRSTTILSRYTTTTASVRRRRSGWGSEKARATAASRSRAPAPSMEAAESRCRTPAGATIVSRPAGTVGGVNPSRTSAQPRPCRYTARRATTPSTLAVTECWAESMDAWMVLQDGKIIGVKLGQDGSGVAAGHKHA